MNEAEHLETRLDSLRDVVNEYHHLIGFYTARSEYLKQVIEVYDSRLQSLQGKAIK